jgi:hypothetical protein
MHKAAAIITAVERSDVQFVICSPWLLKMTLGQLREQAPDWLSIRIVGACEPCESLDEIQHVHRYRSAWSVIDAYVQAHGIEHWLAVDTTADGWPEDAETRERLVVCRPKRGMSDQPLLEAFTEAVRRESREAGEQFEASYEASYRDGCCSAVSESWHLPNRIASAHPPTCAAAGTLRPQGADASC